MFKTQVISFNKILWMELKNIIRLINIIPIIAISLFTVTITIARMYWVTTNTMNLTKELWTNMNRLYLFLLSWKILSDMFLPQNMDKNVTIFLNNNKHIVFFSRTISNIIIFTVPILLYLGIEWLIIVIWWHGPTYNSIYPPIGMRVFISWISIFIFYTFIALSIQFIFASITNKWIKNLVVVSVLFIVIVFYWLIPVELRNDDFTRKLFFYDYAVNAVIYKKWVFYTPIVNIQVLSSFLKFTRNDSLPIGYYIPIKFILPFIFETLAMITILWFFMTRKIKEYLCT